MKCVCYVIYVVYTMRATADKLFQHLQDDGTADSTTTESLRHQRALFEAGALLS